MNKKNETFSFVSFKIGEIFQTTSETKFLGYTYYERFEIYQVPNCPYAPIIPLRTELIACSDQIIGYSIFFRASEWHQIYSLILRDHSIERSEEKMLRWSLHNCSCFLLKPNSELVQLHVILKARNSLIESYAQFSSL